MGLGAKFIISLLLGIGSTITYTYIYLLNIYLYLSKNINRDIKHSECFKCYEIREIMQDYAEPFFGHAL